MTNDLIKFYIPSLDASVFNGAIKLVEYMKTYPERFRDNVYIHSMYGSFPSTLWNGGRARFGTVADRGSLEGTIFTANRLGVALRYTYTNSQITESMLNDTYCNMTMALADNGINEVLVNSPILEDYIRRTYKNFKISLSTTACIRNVDEINKATEKYDLVVLDYRDNKNFEFLNKIERKDKIEILLNETCHKDCSCRKEHYDKLSKIQVFQDCSSDANCMFEPNRERDLSFYSNFELNPDTTITVDELYSTYVDMGFSNFKLLGRNLDRLFQFESYIYYLVKPEWRDRVRYELFYSFY